MLSDVSDYIIPTDTHERSCVSRSRPETRDPKNERSHAPTSGSLEIYMPLLEGEYAGLLEEVHARLLEGVKRRGPTQMMALTFEN